MRAMTTMSTTMAMTQRQYHLAVEVAALIVGPTKLVQQSILVRVIRHRIQEIRMGIEADMIEEPTLQKAICLRMQGIRTSFAANTVEQVVVLSTVCPRMQAIRTSLIEIPLKRRVNTTQHSTQMKDMAEGHMGVTTHLHHRFELVKTKMLSSNDKCEKPQYKVNMNTSVSLKMITTLWKDNTMTCIMFIRAGSTLARQDQVEDVMIATRTKINRTQGHYNVLYIVNVLG